MVRISGSGFPHDAPGFTCLEVPPSRWCRVGQAGEAGKDAIYGLSALTKKLPRRGDVGGSLLFGRRWMLPTETSATGPNMGPECGGFGLARLQVPLSVAAHAEASFRGGFTE